MTALGSIEYAVEHLKSRLVVMRAQQMRRGNSGMLRRRIFAKHQTLGIMVVGACYDIQSGAIKWLKTKISYTFE